MSDNWSIAPLQIEWKFDTHTMSYKGYCNLRQAQYNILWDDLYKYLQCSNGFQEFRVNCVEGKVFSVNPYGAVELPINMTAVESICWHAWNQYRSLTGL